MPKSTHKAFYGTRIVRTDGHYSDYVADAKSAEDARQNAIKKANGEGVKTGTAQIVSINSTMFKRGKVVKF